MIALLAGFRISQAVGVAAELGAAAALADWPGSRRRRVMNAPGRAGWELFTVAEEEPGSFMTADS
jgi:hypothetical protein